MNDSSAVEGGPTRPSRHQRRKAATRQDIVLAGRALLSAEGLYDSRIEDITSRAGIAKGTLYLHFRSKEELAVAVVAGGFEEARAHVTARCAGLTDIVDVAAALLDAHVEFFAENRDLMRILHQVRGALAYDRPRWRPLRACLRAHLQLLAGLLARGRASLWSPRQRLELAVFLFGCASGTCSVLASAYPDRPLQPWPGVAQGVARRVVASAVMKAGQASQGRRARLSRRRSAT